MHVLGQSNFDATDSLANYLRRGPGPYFAASAPAVYIVAASEQDVVQGVQFAIDNDLKLAFHGQGEQQL